MTNGQQLTTQQLTTLLNELNGDPLGLGYANYIQTGPPLVFDQVNLAAILNWLRDGATAFVDNQGVSRGTGPHGGILGATNASPIVIQTDAPHGRATGDSVVVSGVLGNTAANNVPVSPSGLAVSGAVAPNISWKITVIDATHFSLNGSTGNGAYTSGGTWGWSANNLASGAKIPAGSLAVSTLINNILPVDAANATALAGTQATVLPAFLNPNGTLQLTDSAGNELAVASWVKLLTQAGSVSRAATTQLELRFGSRAEQVLSILNQSPAGKLLTGLDIQAAFKGGY